MRVQRKGRPSLDGECTLLQEVHTFDAIGNDIVAYVETEVYCGRLPVTQNEYYAAAQKDIRAEHCLAVHTEEYGGQRGVRFGGAVYDVYRVYEREDELTELYLKKGGA